MVCIAVADDIALRYDRFYMISGRITGGQKMVSFAGRDRTNEGRAGYEGAYKDGEPVQLRLGLLMIDDIVFGTVNAEVFNLIAQRLKKESPFARTMMVSLTNGWANSGFIPNDAAFGYQPLRFCFVDAIDKTLKIVLCIVIMSCQQVDIQEGP